MRKPVGGAAPVSEASCAFCSTSHHAGGGVDSTHTQRTCVVLAPNVRPFRPNGELSAGFRITLAEIFLRRFSRVTGGCPSPTYRLGNWPGRSAAICIRGGFKPGPCVVCWEVGINGRNVKALRSFGRPTTDQDRGRQQVFESWQGAAGGVKKVLQRCEEKSSYVKYGAFSWRESRGWGQ